MEVSVVNILFHSKHIQIEMFRFIVALKFPFAFKPLGIAECFCKCFRRLQATPGLIFPTAQEFANGQKLLRDWLTSPMVA